MQILVSCSFFGKIGNTRIVFGLSKHVVVGNLNKKKRMNSQTTRRLAGLDRLTIKHNNSMFILLL